MVARIALFLLAVSVAGCGGEDRPELYPVTGQLLVNGKPAPGAIVSLHPADGKDFDRRGARPTGLAQKDGSFALSTYRTGDGAPAGEYRVCVTWFDKADDPEKAEDRLGMKYADADKSAIRVRVEAGATELKPIQLEAPARPAAK